MHLPEFNALDEQAAADVVRPCADVDSFVETLVGGRPWADVAALMAAATEQAATWTSAEVEGALADHPRIGERPAGSATSAALSNSEQGGVGTDEETRSRLAEGNRRYEERFGRIHLVRAAGRSAEEILALLEQRLTNDPETELLVTHAQLAEIAVLRLNAVIS